MRANATDLTHFVDVCDVYEGAVDFNELAQHMKDGTYMSMPAPFRPKAELPPHTLFSLAVLKVPNE